MDTPTIISVNNLTKYYGSALGVQNINFTVSQGEIFGFLGPNGAGKTTTIRMLLDLLRPSSGEINIFGHEIYNHSL
jgi:ABC-type multidrug transport system ATPase subunit